MEASCYCSTSGFMGQSTKHILREISSFEPPYTFPPLLSASFRVFSMNKILPGTEAVRPSRCVTNIVEIIFMMTNNSRVSSGLRLQQFISLI